MDSYLFLLQNIFTANQDEVYAANIKRYMRGQFNFYGIPTPKRRELVKNFIKIHGLPKQEKLENLVKECWENPHREFQWTIMEFLFKFIKKMDETYFVLFEYMIIHKSWWDTIDFIATKLVGELFKKYPEKIPFWTEIWMESGNIWLQRTCLLFQLHYKKNTDQKLLDNFIKHLDGSKEFFINKAIGWILREYSKTNAVWVINYVNKNQLAPLSEREALKWLNRKKGER
ncbi:MAG: DNA alkylation repair protein [Bacteroidales bacterium]|nr:DNA alkylation repair protein [Bacteroidales bacterium]